MATLPAGPLVLDIEGKAAGRASVESERGVRLADVHVAPGASVSLRLPTDLGAVFVALERPPGEFRVAPAPGRVVLSQLVARAAPGPAPAAPPTRRSGGCSPGRSTPERWRRSAPTPPWRPSMPEPEPPRSALRTAGWTAAAVGVAGLATGGGLLLSARQLSQDGTTTA